MSNAGTDTIYATDNTLYTFLTTTTIPSTGTTNYNPTYVGWNGANNILSNVPVSVRRCGRQVQMTLGRWNNIATGTIPAGNPTEIFFSLAVGQDNLDLSGLQPSFDVANLVMIVFNGVEEVAVLRYLSSANANRIQLRRLNGTAFTSGQVLTLQQAISISWNI